ncbi:MAG TPA: Na+/H+ antiporter subunit E [Dehalococcoidales bacterium]|nr:Na+/H+ antiporter subunit E [Dehalococcoidales bacterium]
MKSSLRSKNLAGHWQERLTSVVLQFIILFAFWLILSGHYQLKYILIGAVAAGLVTFLTNDLFYSALRRGVRVETKVQVALLQLWRFIVYLPWLFSRIIMANVQVAYLVLHPKMPIDPVLFLFRTRMRKGISQVTLANSITLTPGTITVSLEDGKYIIHTLKPTLASELVEAVMQNKIAKIYLEEKEPPPVARWVYSLEELGQ